MGKALNSADNKELSRKKIAEMAWGGGCEVPTIVLAKWIMGLEY